MRVRLRGWVILLSIALNVITFLEVRSQSQQYPPLHISDNFIYQNWTARDGLPVNSISSVTQTPDGYIWLGTADGLVRFDGISFRIFKTMDFPDLRYNRIRGLASYQDKLLILNSNMDFILFDGRNFELIPTTESLTGTIFSGVIELDSGEILFPTTNHEIYTISNNGIIKVLEDKRESLVNRSRGDIKWRAYQRELYSVDELIFNSGDQINEVITDREGNTWVATHSKGLYKLKYNFFETFSIEEGLPSRNIYPVTTTKEGVIWMGTYGGGIASIEQNQVKTGYLFEGQSASLFIQSIIERENREIFVAILDGSIYKYSGDQIFEKHSSLNNGTVYCLFEDSEQVFWAGTSSGLYYFENGGWQKVDNPVLANASVKTIAEAGDGSLWIGTQGQGLIHLKGVSVKAINKNSGLASNLIRSIWIETSSQSGNYHVWAGTEESGLTRIIVQNWSPLPINIVSIGENEGLFDNIVHKIIPDEFGRLWMSSNNGLFWVFRHDLDQFSKGNIQQITSTAFTEVDGLRNREANGGIQPAGVKDRDGILWFPTQDGLIKADPKLIARNNVIPTVQIDKIESKEEIFEPVSGSVKPVLGDRDLEFHFAVLSFSSPEKNKLKFRLFGLDDDWIDASGQRSIRYTNIPPGQYRFKVIGSNNDGVWNQQGAVVNITIASHFYESAWFYVLIACLFGIQIMIIAIVAQHKTKKRISEKDQEIEAAFESIQNLKMQLKEHDKLKESLLFNLNKDLRNPVLSLREQVKLEREPVKKIVDRETGNILSYIDQLLLLTEIELKSYVLNPKPEDLIEVVKSSIKLHKNNANEKDPVIELTTNSEKVIIYLDINLVLVLLKNLINRAANHDEVNKIRIQIIEESSICTVKIVDDGQAISHEELHSIFDLFKTKVRTRDSQSYLGIELPLVAKLVELHNASIVVHAVPETGNTFSVIFKKGSQHLNYSEEKI